MKKFSLVLLSAIAVLAIASCTSPVSLTEDPAMADKPEITRDTVRAISLSSKDAYENDDTKTASKTITVGAAAQEHNFYDDATDWLKFTSVAGTVYEIETWVLGTADTYLYVYQGTTLVGSNDDKATGDYGSKVTFTASSSTTCYIKVYSYGGKKGTNRGYNVSAIVSGSGGGGGGGITLPQPRKAWTVLVYLDADNNLSSYGTTDVTEMKAVGSNADINVVVLWDNSSSTHGYYYIENGAATLLRDVGECDMGNTATAKTFLDYAAANFPADKYMWTYWNHGGAVDRGVCWDDTNSGNWLTEVEQAEVMAYGNTVLGQKFEVVGFDACLMATGEIAYQYRNYANYLVASEQTEPGDGWDYHFLSVLKATPSITGAVASKAVFDYYKTWYSGQSDITFSTADLSYADDLGAAIGAFSTAAINSGVAGSTFKTLAANLSNFSGYTKDLAGYMAAIIASSSVTQGVKDAATVVKNLIVNSLVTNNYAGSTWTGKAYGMSITLKADTTVYSQLDLCAQTQWDEFLTFAGFTSTY